MTILQAQNRFEYKQGYPIRSSPVHLDLLIQIRGNRRGVLGAFGCDGEQCERNREVLMADDDIVRCAEMRGREI